MIRVICLFISMLLLGCDIPNTVDEVQFEFSDTTFVFDDRNQTQILRIVNTGDTDIVYLISWYVDWLGATPTSGTIEAGSDGSIYISVSGNNLADGEYQNALTIAINEVVYHVWISLSIPPPPTNEELGTWEIVESNTTDDLTGIQFVSSNIGWAFSSRRLLRSTDSGVTWSEYDTPIAPNYIRDMQWLNENLGWVLYGGSILLRTQDGGATWDSLTCPAAQFYSSIYFLDDSTGWLGGYAGVFHTQDAGQTWTNQLSYMSSGLVQTTSFSFVNSQVGWLTYWTHADDGIGGPSYDVGYLYRTVDGGANWETISNLDGYLRKVIFFDENTGFLNAGVLMKSLDGGHSWEETNMPGGVLYFLNNNYGWTAGSKYETIDGYLNYYHHLWVTMDGGESYVSFVETTDKYKWIEAIYFFDQSHGWAVGRYGKILRYIAPE